LSQAALATSFRRKVKVAIELRGFVTRRVELNKGRRTWRGFRLRVIYAFVVRREQSIFTLVMSNTAWASAREREAMKDLDFAISRRSTCVFAFLCPNISSPERSSFVFRVSYYSFCKYPTLLVFRPLREKSHPSETIFSPDQAISTRGESRNAVQREKILIIRILVAELTFHI
jgi:hypothetical protein